MYISFSLITFAFNKGKLVLVFSKCTQNVCRLRMYLYALAPFFNIQLKTFFLKWYVLTIQKSLLFLSLIVLIIVHLGPFKFQPFQTQPPYFNANRFRLRINGKNMSTIQISIPRLSPPLPVALQRVYPFVTIAAKKFTQILRIDCFNTPYAISHVGNG